ncbi:NADPH-dependent oxidoreductase [Dokdonia sinensis]|uniref:NADPH-dependent oxidoreductase n=1 Tax=Dokdonia sinensis TaxID=2479847 RepID=A0A3M0GRY2_9FLAO|nr:NAD(P)H-dependent oxidoreductase [Dokdonia sinensis]RMB63969.1 NADPH-dependent oxidoreductase [Dokdonia sinensis]
MKRVLAFAGSNSSSSINVQLANYVLNHCSGADKKMLLLTDYNLPMYNIDIEQSSGIPIDINLLKAEISRADGVIIAVNEHNGMVSAFFKNIIDWLSRADRNFLEDKKVLLISTSPGARGGSSALEYTEKTLPRFGANVVERFSFPSFQQHFNVDAQEITDPLLQMGIQEVIASFLNELEG